MVQSPSNIEMLERAAGRLATDDRFLSSLLAGGPAGRLNIDQLARELNCSPETIVRLALCFRPRQSPTDFQADVGRIATSLGMSEERLTVFLREAEVLAAFRRPPAADQGMLAAARDRISTEEDGGN
jgi:hypothetical protein